MSDYNSQHNRAVWFDIPVIDLERAASFYRRKGATVPRDRALRFAGTMESDRGDAHTT